MEIVNLYHYVKFAVVVVCVVISGSIAHPATPAQNSPALRSSSNLVLVPVAAVDKAGHFASGLSAADFRVLVDGKPVELASFEAITEAPLPSDSYRSRFVLPAHTFRNISEFAASRPNLVILLADYLNTSLVDRMGLREGLLKYLATKKTRPEEIAVYGLTDRLVLLQPFTHDPSALVDIAANLLKQKGQLPDPKIGRPLVKPGEEPMTQMTGQGTDAGLEYLAMKEARREYNFDQLHRAQRTLEAFREMARSLGGLPGKKTVIWLTGDASPLNPTMLYRMLVTNPDVQTEATPWWEMAKTYELLNGAGVSIFPLDIRGIANQGLLSAGQNLSHDEFQQTFRGSQANDFSSYPNPTAMRQGEAANAVLAMDTVASETGGKVLAGSNDLAKLMGQAQQLWANYYVLAFVPERPADNRVPVYHKIKVTVARSGVQLLARRGYISRPRSLISANSEIERDLVEAAASPIDLTSVPIQISLKDHKDLDKTRHFPFSVEVFDVLAKAPSGKSFPYDVSIAILLRDQDGNVKLPVGERMRGVLDSAELPDAATERLKFDGEFQAPIGTYYFGRVIVRDNLSGRLGTITLTLATAP